MRKLLMREMGFENKLCLQCGRIYKDAEIIQTPRCRSHMLSTFNVAASIKMRKFPVSALAMVSTPFLQCSRIYKDAEIYVLILSE